MRSFFVIAACVAALAGYSALAANAAETDADNIAPPFAENGVYIPAGQTIEVAIAGQCHRFTNHNANVGFFFSPAQPDSWPSVDETKRALLEPVVTEAPCK